MIDCLAFKRYVLRKSVRFVKPLANTHTVVKCCQINAHFEDLSDNEPEILRWRADVKRQADFLPRRVTRVGTEREIQFPMSTVSLAFVFPHPK